MSVVLLNCNQCNQMSINFEAPVIVTIGGDRQTSGFMGSNPLDDTHQAF